MNFSNQGRSGKKPFWSGKSAVLPGKSAVSKVVLLWWLKNHQTIHTPSGAAWLTPDQSHDLPTSFNENWTRLWQNQDLATIPQEIFLNYRLAMQPFRQETWVWENRWYKEQRLAFSNSCCLRIKWFWVCCKQNSAVCKIIGKAKSWKHSWKHKSALCFSKCFLFFPKHFPLKRQKIGHLGRCRNKH